MKIKTIGPHETLQPGTAVKVGNYRGTVLKARTASNRVVVHTVRLVDRLTAGIGRKTVWKRIAKPIAKEINYSSIEVINEQKEQ